MGTHHAVTTGRRLASNVHSSAASVNEWTGSPLGILGIGCFHTAPMRLLFSFPWPATLTANDGGVAPIILLLLLLPPWAWREMGEVYGLLTFW